MINDQLRNVGVTLTQSVFILFTGIGLLIGQEDQTDFSNKDFQDVVQRSARLRKLNLKKDVKGRIITREELQNRLMADLNREDVLDQIEVLKKKLTALGLIEKSRNLKKHIQVSLERQISGVYDSENEEILVIKQDEKPQWMTLFKKIFGKSWKKVALIPEATKALQDQHFNIDQLTHTNDDVNLALRALIEGDAATLQLKSITDLRGTVFTKFMEYLENAIEDKLILGGQEIKKKDSVPLIIRRRSLFPYAAGLYYVANVLKNHGLEGLNKRFRNTPPISTEQILHPRSRKEYPMMIDLPKIKDLPPNWNHSSTSTLGEFQLLMMFRHHMPDKVKEMTGGVFRGIGWGGDRFSVYYNSKKDRHIVIWFTAWDDQGAAKRFFTKYKKVCQQKFSDAKKDDSFSDDPLKYMATGDEGTYYLDRRGPYVLSIERAPAEKIANIRDQIWSNVKVHQITSVKRTRTNEGRPGKLVFEKENKKDLFPGWLELTIPKSKNRIYVRTPDGYKFKKKSGSRLEGTANKPPEGQYFVAVETGSRIKKMARSLIKNLSRKVRADKDGVNLKTRKDYVYAAITGTRGTGYMRIFKVGEAYLVQTLVTDTLPFEDPKIQRRYQFRLRSFSDKISHFLLKLK